MKTYKIALADDHVLMRNGLAALIDSFQGYKVIFQGANGEEVIDGINPAELPDIILLDINMPKKDGYETARWLTENHPSVKILALSMYDNENAIIKMLQNGARGYILKDTEPHMLKSVLEALITEGYYYSALVTGHLISTLAKRDPGNKYSPASLSAREKEFLIHCCTEMTYKEIAEKMFLSPRTIEGYRDSLCEKLDIKSRVGLVIYAIKEGLVNLTNTNTR